MMLYSHLNCVIPKTTNDFSVIILKTVYTLRCLTMTLDSIQLMMATPPVVFNILKGKREKISCQLSAET